MRREPVEGGGKGVEHVFDSPEEEEGVAVAMGFEEGDGIVAGDGFAFRICHVEVESKVVEGRCHAVEGIGSVNGAAVPDCLDLHTFIAQEFQSHTADIEGSKGDFVRFPKGTVEFIVAW